LKEPNIGFLTLRVSHGKFFHARAKLVSETENVNWAFLIKKATKNVPCD